MFVCSKVPLSVPFSVEFSLVVTDCTVCPIRCVLLFLSFSYSLVTFVTVLKGPFTLVVVFVFVVMFSGDSTALNMLGNDGALAFKSTPNLWETFLRSFSTEEASFVGVILDFFS